MCLTYSCKSQIIESWKFPGNCTYNLAARGCIWLKLSLDQLHPALVNINECIIVSISSEIVIKVSKTINYGFIVARVMVKPLI